MRGPASSRPRGGPSRAPPPPSPRPAPVPSGGSGAAASESRLRAMLAAALDAVVNMDERGCVTGWNPAAEATFGYSAEDARGREMAELIVPPSLRDAHRRGLARYLESGTPVVLDRRLELTGMHRDGTEFPVELTITRIEQPGAPSFTGYLR